MKKNNRRNRRGGVKQRIGDPQTPIVPLTRDTAAAGFPTGLPQSITPQKAVGSQDAQGSEMYAGTLTTGFNRWGSPRITPVLIAQYEYNAVLADPVKNIKRLMFKDEPTYTVYDPEGEEDPDLSKAAEFIGTHYLNVYAKAQWCYNDSVFGGCAVFTFGWETQPVPVGDSDIEMVIPAQCKHLPWRSFWQQPPGYMTVYNPIMMGIVIDRNMQTHVYQVIDQFVDLGSVGGNPSGLYHLVEIMPRHPADKKEAEAWIHWKQQPAGFGFAPELTGPTCFKIIKDPATQDPSGLPECLPVIPLVTQYDHANQCENQRMNRIGAPLVFPKVGTLTEDNKPYIEAMLARWGKDTGFICSEDGIKEFLNPYITDNQSARDRMEYLKAMISSFWNPATVLKEATGGSSMGRSDAGASEMLNGRINNTLSWIEDGFEDIFNEWLELNKYHGYKCVIEFPRSAQRNDAQINTDLKLLADKGAITKNELRQSMPSIQFPRVEDDPAFDQPIEAAGSKNPFESFGSAPVGNVLNPVQRTDAYKDTETELSKTIKNWKKDILKVVYDAIPEEGTKGINNTRPNTPVDKPSLIQRAKNILSPVDNADEGSWVTISGNHILLKEGETPAEGFKRTTGKTLSKGSGGGTSSKSTSESKSSNTSIGESERGRFSDKSVASKGAIEAEKALPESVTSFSNLAQSDPSVKWYTDDGYEEINTNLRGKSSKEEMTLGETGKHIADHAAQIDRVIARAPELPEGTVLYRGVGRSSGESIANAEIGSVISDKAYQSHSLDAAKAGEFAKVYGNNEKTIIRAVTNGKQRAIYTNANKEYEALLPRGGKWMVSSKDTIVTNGIKTHVVTVVPA